MAYRYLILLVSLAATAGGCADNTSCVADDECFKHEVCVEELCQRPEDVVENNANNEPDNSQTAQSNATNSVSENNPTNNTANNPPNNSNSNSNSGTNSNNGSNNASGLCRGTTFESCPPDEDATSPTMLSGAFGRGCVMPNDDFEAGAITADAVMCPLEESDSFSVSVNPCATTSFFIDVEIIPAEMCAPNDFELDVSLNGNDCEEGSGLVECSDRDDGGKKAMIVVEPSSSTAVLYIDVLPLIDNLRFDYDVVVTFRQ